MAHGYVTHRVELGGNPRKRYDLLMHRLITAAPDGLVVHHRNHNTLDNRRKNLVVCRTRDNVRHQRAQKTKKFRSVFKGVTRGRNSKNYFAQMAVMGRQQYLGTFKREVDAAKAYDRAVLKHAGPFALTNKRLGLL